MTRPPTEAARRLLVAAVAVTMVVSVVAVPGLVAPAEAADAGDGTASLAQEQAENHTEAAERGAERGILLAQAQGANVTQEQRQAVIDGAVAAAEQRQNVTVTQVQLAARGAAHGTVLQAQRVNASQAQSIAQGAAAGALQQQDADVVQLQSAAYGAAHGSVAGSQNATAEQLQHAAEGGAHGAASVAVQQQTANVSQIQEAGQGAAYGALTHTRNVTYRQSQNVSVEQEQTVDGQQVQNATVRQAQNVTVEQIRAAAVGAAEGAYSANETADVKQVRAAATGAAQGALVQSQNASVEQIQASARGASAGSLRQVQRATVTQIQEAAFGAAKGSISQYQVADIEQIQAAAQGGAEGAIVQIQRVDVVQIQHAASGAARGAARTAGQRQVANVDQVQAAARGAAEGSVTQVQIVNVVQIQVIAEGASGGALEQSQTANVVQIQSAAQGAARGATTLTQRQEVNVEQIQIVVQRAANRTAGEAAERGETDSEEIADDANQSVEEEVERGDEPEQRDDEQEQRVVTASLALADQEGDGTNLSVDEATANTAFVVEASADGETLNETTVDANETFKDNLTLDPPLENDSTVTVTVRDAETGDALVDGTLEYTVIEEEPAPTATLDVENQTGNGTNLTVENASGSVDYYLDAHVNETTRNETDTFDAGESFEGNLTLEPPLEENATVEVAVHDAETDEELNATNVTYNVTPAGDEMSAGEERPTANVTVENQSSNGTTVVVNETNSTNGTFVAIHETTADGEVGDVIGVSEFLPAGPHENVSVDLFDAAGLETNRTALTENQTLVAMPHEDTDSDRDYDFLTSNGSEDGPYLNDTGAPVTDDAFVTVATENVTNVTDNATNVTDEVTSALDVENQTGDGVNLSVENASASVDYYVNASVNDTTLNETNTLDADESFEGNLTLDPPLEENSTVEVTIHDAETGEELNATNASYNVTNVTDNLTDNATNVTDNLTDDATNVTDNVTPEDEEEERPTANVTFENQTSNGTSVVVDEVNSSNGTFVAIHETTATGEVGEVIGVSEFLPAGPHENVSVELFDVAGLETNRTALTQNGTLVTEPHLDSNDNREFDYLTTNETEDPPYLNGTGEPVTDDAFVTVDSENETDNVTNVTENVSATLDVENQTGDGVNLSIDNASAGVDYYLDVHDNDTTLNETDTLDANESFESDLTLDPPLEENATVEVAIHDAETDEELNATNVTYNVTPAAENVSTTLDVENQTGDGTNLSVAAASADTAFYLNASVNDTTHNETESFDAGESFEGNLSLDPAIGENSTVRVAVHDAETDEELNATNISYEAAVTNETTDALAEYEDVDAARDDGYVDTHEFDINETGATGIRFVNTAALDDGELDPREPEILLYTVNESGEYELLGAEWYSPETTDEPPALFNETFQGPLPGHIDELDSHYGLYAWLFEEHPVDQFAQRNPAVDAPDLITVSNQTGDGSAVTVDRTLFAEEYVVEVRDESGTTLGQSGTITGEMTDVEVQLDAALEANATLEVALLHPDGSEIAEPVLRETVGYTVEAPDESEAVDGDTADNVTNTTENETNDGLAGEAPENDETQNGLGQESPDDVNESDSDSLDNETAEEDAGDNESTGTDNETNTTVAA